MTGPPPTSIGTSPQYGNLLQPLTIQSQAWAAIQGVSKWDFGNDQMRLLAPVHFAFKGVAYQYTVLPFGLSLAPCTFMKYVDAALCLLYTS